jgi:hypothetical protein
MSTAPHVPTAPSSTAAIDGFFKPASSGCVNTPSDNSDTAISRPRQIRKPTTVARPTSSRARERAE